MTFEEWLTGERKSIRQAEFNRTKWRAVKTAIESSANCCTCSNNHVNIEIGDAIRALEFEP